MSIETWKCIALMFGSLSCGVGLGWALRGYRFVVRADKSIELLERARLDVRARLAAQRASDPRIIADDEARP